jgi:TolB-like protein/Flp pilus assembly protein TadD
MFVIARNSTFTYKGKPVKVKRVAEEFGVQYVLEGSVQRSGDRIRITAQLIDALNARHLWSERYDRELKDLFALQDDITMEILRALRVKLTAGEQAAFRLKHQPNPDVYTKYLQAREYSLTHVQEDNIKARKMAEEIISLDPKYANGYVRLGGVELQDVWQGISKSPKESLTRAVELAKMSIEIEDNPGAHILLANIYFLFRKWDEAIVEGKKAIEMVPNGAGAHIALGITLAFADRGHEAIPILEKGIRLSPYPETNYLHSLAFAYFLAEKYEEGIEAARRAVRIQPKNPIARRGLVACYFMSGREEEARAEALKAIRLDPNWSISEAQSRVGLGIKNKNQAKKYYDALRKAGIPEHPPLPLPDKPSIAVLPFTNMSDDPKQEYFSDGISEEIITALSKSSQLFVIARESSFSYKGKQAKVQQIARELGVRYILEGSVRKSEDRVRITAQLIDGTKGQHLWAERYDRDLKDIFALQDEITMKIVTALRIELTDGEQARMWGKKTKNLNVLLKSMEAQSLFYKGTRESLIRYGQVGQEIIDMAPDADVGYRILAWAYWSFAVRAISPRENIPKSFKLAQKALSIDENYSLNHALLGSVYLSMRQYEKAIAAGKRSIELAPNGAMEHGLLGNTLGYAERMDEAIAYLKQGIRLNPFPPYWYFFHLGRCYNQKGQYQAALAEFKKALQLAPGHFGAQVGITVAYSLLGRAEEARAAAKKVLEIKPYFTVGRALASLKRRYKNPADVLYLGAGLRKAGLPE